MPHDPLIARQDVIEKISPGQHDRVMLTIREAPVSGDDAGKITIDEDLRQAYDEWAAKQVMNTLEAAYPGHCWRVVHDTHQGVCLISIPILMGVNNYMAVNLKTHAMDARRAILAGGEILERYGLLRGAFQLGPFLEAREKHSALIVPGRPVPE